MTIEVYRLLPNFREIPIKEGQFIEIRDEQIIAIGKRYFELVADMRGEE